ncbi:amidohydrolase family protein [Paraglaciecola hydrolytica]|uniref:Amidohydrolase-related domain-containing protein n=1 Tax=Paraglaciecola hydrolytica TaxID=1799789 RepID=A0A136A091_9ALTE|nr:amidohydrolase family protein [Paraglaciecola hydrolytica]KXI28641.1 hypothetical protein AX660_16295 [Paraglaciecola hydrolytica]
MPTKPRACHSAAKLICRNWLFLFCCSLASTSLTAQEGNVTPFAVKADDNIVIYHNANVLDENGQAFTAKMSVIVTGDKIQALKPANQISANELKSAQVINLSDKYLLPGLIDSHVHLATPPNDLFAKATMRRQAYHGITGIRIMADDLRPITEYARASIAGEIAAPDIYSAALFAGPDFFNDPRTIAANGGIKPGTGPWMQAISDETDLTIAIAKAKGSGAMAIKLYDNLKPELLSKITQAAHQQGMAIWAHGMVFPTEPKDVVAAGVDVISHTCYLAYQASDPKPLTYKNRFPVNAALLQTGDNHLMETLFASMQQQNIYLDATLTVYQQYDQRLAANPQMSPKPHCSLSLAATLTQQAINKGVKIATGTDHIMPRSSAFPALFDELELLAKHTKLSPLAVIQAATLNGAYILKQQDNIGSITAGKLANMLILNADPSADISKLRDQYMTVKRGFMLKPQDMPNITELEMPDEQ